MSALRVDEVLKGSPPDIMTVGQGVTRTTKNTYTNGNQPFFPVLVPGRHYLAGLVDNREYRDGWLWFATPVDNVTTAVRSRWKTAVTHQAARRDRDQEVRSPLLGRPSSRRKGPPRRRTRPPVPSCRPCCRRDRTSRFGDDASPLER